MSAARLAAAAVTVYQRLLAPLLPPACRFAPSCSEYARQSLLARGVLVGTALALWRLARCHPFHPGGWDPPPAGRKA